FSYQGGFALSALAGGAIEATAVDSSETALLMASSHSLRNNLDLNTIHSDVFDVFDYLPGKYDLIICDPPKLAPRKSHLEKGLSAYRYLCKQCLNSLNEGGLLLVSSCSQIIQAEDLRIILVQQANKLHIELDVIAMTHQPADHPWPAAFTTSRYLSSILVELR
ncbi:MAG: class I SAM-dependent methyltransferase, partial [Planctomycetes bacterium]|nr:class I SAM-dependent methyltransferase [Planctomycetota bacterium]